MSKTITKVYKNKTEDNKNYVVIQLDDGEKYGVWKEELFSQCVEGNKIEFTFTQKGQYKNIDWIKVIDASQNVTVTKPRENTMIRMNALNNSVHLLQMLSEAKLVDKEDLNVTEVFRIADLFIAYITKE